MAKLYEFNERDLTPALTMVVNVEVHRSLAVRLGLWLIILGCRISGIRYEDHPDDLTSTD